MFESLIKELRSSIEEPEVVGYIPCNGGSVHITIHAPCAVNDEIYSTIGALQSLNEEFKYLRWCHGQMLCALNWDYEVTLLNRMKCLSYGSIIEMASDIINKIITLRRVLGVAQSLSIDYPDSWIDLSQEEVSSWCREYDRYQWSLMI